MGAEEFDVLQLGCGENQHGDAWNVDVNASVGPDEVVDLDQLPWPWPDESFDTVRAVHVLEHLDDLEGALLEVGRVLEPGGTLLVKWPIGVNEIADPDHQHRWVWDTPLYYTGERHWDVDVGLDVTHRHVSLHLHLDGSAGWLYKWFLRLYHRAHGDGRWAFDMPATSGEFTVVFRKDE